MSLYPDVIILVLIELKLILQVVDIIGFIM